MAVVRNAEHLAIEPTQLFDQSRENQEDLLRQRLHSDRWKREALSWLKRGTASARKSRATREQLQGVPLGEGSEVNQSDLLYTYFLYEEAQEIIAFLFPTLRPALGRVDKNVFLVDQDYEEDLFAPFYNIVSGIPFISYPQYYGVGQGLDRYLDELHGFRLSTMVHELLHAVLNEKYTLYTLDPTRPEEVRLSSVLHEALSMAAHAELYQLFRANSGGDNRCLGKLEYFLQHTAHVMREAAAKQYSERRFSMDQRKNWEVNHLQGLQLAKVLGKNGWRLQDFPELTSRIRSLLRQETGSDGGEAATQILYSTEAGSPYQRLIRQFRNLKRRSDGGEAVL